MISVWRLLLVPIITSPILLIPLIGWFVYPIIVIYWYVRNQESIHLYFRGVNYEQNEIIEDELEKWK